jgi:hypothetical protein
MKLDQSFAHGGPSDAQIPSEERTSRFHKLMSDSRITDD